MPLISRTTWTSARGMSSRRQPPRLPMGGRKSPEKHPRWRPPTLPLLIASPGHGALPMGVGPNGELLPTEAA
eukprot:3918114-Alexandrium_andersonii.AAC.1